MFLVKHYIYLIRCKPTGRRYVGSTSSFPGNQWAYHWSQLRNKNHINQRFQREWSEYPSLIHWEFSVLEVIDERLCRRVLQQIEARYITSMDNDLRLNMPNRTTLSLEKHRRVEKMLEAGVLYRDIVAEVGLSLGMISKIRARMNEEIRRKFKSGDLLNTPTAGDGHVEQ